MKYIHLSLFFNVLCTSTVIAMEKSEFSNPSYNSYFSTPITPETLPNIAPRMPEDLKSRVDLWMELPWNNDCKSNKDFVAELAKRPKPYSIQSHREQAAKNMQHIKSNNCIETSPYLLDEKHAKEGNHYVYAPPGNFFWIKQALISRKLPYIMYPKGYNVLKQRDPQKGYDINKVDLSQFDEIPCYENVSRVAHYLKIDEAIKTDQFQHVTAPPTYLYHLPDHPETLTDENYIVIQEPIRGFKTLYSLPEREQQTTVKNYNHRMLQEIYLAIKEAALWNMHDSIGIDPEKPSSIPLVYFEMPFTHLPQDFYFQGDHPVDEDPNFDEGRGYTKYVNDIKKSCTSTHNMLRKLGGYEKANEFKAIIQDDRAFIDDMNVRVGQIDWQWESK